MAIDLLGETLDIHCGGIDLIFPHHEDEIAQCEAATGQHVLALLVPRRVPAHRRREDGQASRATCTTVQGLREAKCLGGGASALRVQHALSEGAQPVRGGARGVDQGGAARGRFRRAAARRRRCAGGTPELATAADEAVAAVEAALFDDLNAPKALAALFTSSDGRTPSSTGGAAIARRWSGRGRRSRASTACSTSCRTRAGADAGARGVGRGAARGAAGGARAAGFRRGGPDSRRADGARGGDRGCGRRGTKWKLAR